MAGEIAETFTLEGEVYCLISAAPGLTSALEEAEALLPPYREPQRWELAVEQGRLLLKRLYFYNKEEKPGPVPENYGDGTFSRSMAKQKATAGIDVYEPDFPLSYSGPLLLCRGLLHRYYRRPGRQAPWSFQQSLELAFDRGILISTADVHETVGAARDLLYQEEGQEELLELAGRVWWLRRCLGLERQL